MKNINKNQPNIIDPNNIQLKNLKILYSKRKFKDAILVTQKLLKEYPNSIILYTILGACYAALKKFNMAIINYKKTLIINPNHAEAYFNIGIAFHDKGEIKKAIISYKKAINIKFNYSNAYVNMGNSLKVIGNIEDAIISYKSALKFNPNHIDANYNLGVAYHDKGLMQLAMDNYKNVIILSPNHIDALNNMGNIFKEYGNLDESIKSYTKSLKINPKHLKTASNLHILFIQIENNFSKKNKKIIPSELKETPKYLIHQTIKYFINNDIKNAKSCLNKFKSNSKSGIRDLKKIDQKFCFSYFNYINSLIKTLPPNRNSSKLKIYHIGESHSLSFAHHEISLRKEKASIQPLLTIGAKAYHMSKNENNSYKAITLNHLQSIPKASVVFLSFGEIDCRIDEGFLIASKKLDTAVSVLVNETIKKFIKWFKEINCNLCHELYFFNLPAPIFRSEYNTEENQAISKLIDTYNKILFTQIKKTNFKIIDVYNNTIQSDGYSNNLHHIDETHLGPSILPWIENQIC